jgi:type I restriction enzyme S subunit
MARVKKNNQKKRNNGANVGYEAELWQMADALRGSMDAAEYKHVVLGLIFLKYISDAFEEQHAKLEAERAQGADPEDPDEYRALNIFWVPPEARWSHLKAQAKQPTIAQLLGTLDDKIELNRRMNETLEAIARAIVKSWFVDFDPVRAKAEGRDPGLPNHVADLFPDRFEDSELGQIPAGWKAVTLPEVIEVNPPRSLKKGQIAPYLDMTNMPTRGHSPDVVVQRPFGSGMRFINGDTLVARITPCLENGKTAFVDFLSEDQVGWGSTEYIVLRPKPPLPEEFAYCLARSMEFREFAIQSMTGTSGRQRVRAESLSHYLLVAPPEQLGKRFGSFVRPLFARASAAALESRTFSALRDALLPKLISGELRVKYAERTRGTM